MIISDKHQFVFIHIPKCAGSTVKAANRKLSDTHFFSGEITHPELGKIEWPVPTHMPLWALADYYPEVFSKIKAYKAFAVVRDPFERFGSAIMQYGREFRGLTSAELTNEKFAELCREVIAWLKDNQVGLNPHYIHFTPQADYILLGEDRVVEELCVAGNFTPLNKFLREHELNPVPEKEAQNSSVTPSNPVIALIINKSKPLYQSYLSPQVKKNAWRLLIKFGLFQPSMKRYSVLREDADIAAFIEEYYARDFPLYRETVARLEAA